METKIKLCGLKSPADIEMVNRLKPEFVGFVMWEKSHRNVSRDRLMELKALLDKDIKAVGVFVDEDTDLISGLANEGLVDLLQLHGNESEQYIKELHSKLKGDTKIIKAFKTDSESIEKALNSSADYLLFDPGKGDGMTFSWEVIKDFPRPFFLAGGLNPENVEAAINMLQPFAVDVSSGIETDKIKDPVKAEAFVQAVRK